MRSETIENIGLLYKLKKDIQLILRTHFVFELIKRIDTFFALIGARHYGALSNIRRNWCRNGTTNWVFNPTTLHKMTE